MRILIINTYYAPEIVGGAEYSVKKLAEQLQKNGHTVLILCTGKNNVMETVDGIQVVRLRSNNLCRGIESQKRSKMIRIIRRTLDIWNPMNAVLFWKAITRFSPDVIHTNGLYDISPVIWKVAKKLNVPVVHTLRDYHLLCPFTSLTCDKSTGQCEVPPKLFCKLHRNINRKSSRLVDLVTAPSSVTLELLVAHGFFQNAEHIVIPNATDVDEMKIKGVLKEKMKASTREKAGICFVYLGKLSQQKGVHWLLESFRALPYENVRLCVAGKGQLEEWVESVANEDKRIQFVGFLNEDGVEALLRKSDVLICPSQWQEPFGRVVLDAYKNAMPVIVSDCGALPSLVEPFVTGTVVSSGNVQELSEAMAEYIQQPSLVLERGSAATRKIMEYSVEFQAEQFQAKYQQLIDQIAQERV